jgi:hypothetical protein
MIVQMKFLYFPPVLVTAVNIAFWSPVCQHTGFSYCTDQAEPEQWFCVELKPQHAGLIFVCLFVLYDLLSCGVIFM